MADGEGDFIKSLQAIAFQALRDGDGHPESEELLAYSTGEMSKDEARRIDAHLAVCPGCTQVLADLDTFPNVELRNESLQRTQEEEAADWKAIQERIAAEKADVASHPVIPRGSSLSWIHALAAGLLAAVLGLSFWVAHLKLQMKTSSDPQSNVYIRDLLPSTAANSRDSAAGNAISVPVGLNNVVLVLALGDFQPFLDYQVKIFDSAGKLRWSQAGMVRMPDGSFTLEVRRDLLPSGSYLVQLYGLKSKQQKLLATYPLRIAYAP